MSQFGLSPRWAFTGTISTGTLTQVQNSGNLSASWDDSAKQLTLTLAGAPAGILPNDAVYTATARGVAATGATMYVLLLSNASTATSWVFECWNLAATPAVATPNAVAVEIRSAKNA